MRRRLLLAFGLPLLLGAFVMTAPAALAQSPHFNPGTQTATLSGVDLNVSFMESGLGNNVSITYTANADATATYVCVNKGGANPSASNKTNVSGPVSAKGTFSSGKNGNISQTLILMPPSPPSSFSCPKGQTEETAEVVYTNVSITDDTNSITADIPGTFDTGCLLPNVKGACS